MAGLASCATRLPPAPEPIAPLSGTDFDHFPRVTELKWHPVPNAVSYSIEVDCFHCCQVGKWCSEVATPRISASGIKTTSYRFEWPATNLGRWRVWAVTSTGTQGTKSAWEDFLYKQ